MQIREIRFKIRVVIEKDDDVGFFAYCPDLEGVAVEGATEQEIQAHMACAIRGHLESLAKHNDPIPVGVLEMDETHDFWPFVGKKLSEKLGISKSREYIQEIMFETDQNNHATV